MVIGVFKFRPFLARVFRDRKRGSTIYSTIDVASLRMQSNFSRRSYTYRYSVRVSLNKNGRLLMMLGVCKFRPFPHRVFPERRGGYTIYSTIDVTSRRMQSNFTRRSYTHRNRFSSSFNKNGRKFIMQDIVNLFCRT